MKDAKGHGSDPRGASAPAAHQKGVEAVQRAFDEGHHFASYMQHTGKDKLFRVSPDGKLHPPGAGSVAAIRSMSRAGKVKAEPTPGITYGVRYRRV